MGDRTRLDHYRSRKDSGVALYYLWRTGEAMVARRTPSFERIYALAERVDNDGALLVRTDAGLVRIISQFGSDAAFASMSAANAADAPATRRRSGTGAMYESGG